MKRVTSFFRRGTGLHANRSPAGTVLIFVILLLFCGFAMLPLIYSVAQSLKPTEELFAYPPRFFVQNPTLANYAHLFRLTGGLWVPFSRYLFNSVATTAVGTFVYVMIASMAAYPLALGDFKAKRLINEIVVNALLFTGPVLGVAQYLIISKTGMLNTYYAMVLPALAAPLGLFLMRQFMVQMVPRTIIEAAKIDGAGTFGTFWTIVMPMVKPAWLTLGIFTFQTLWSGVGQSYIFDESLKVLPTVLGQIAAGGMARAGAAAAAAVLLMIPPVCIFLFAQSRVVETMSASGIKE